MNRLRSSRSFSVSLAFADFTHTARHTFATISLNSGADITSVMTMLGHTNTKQTLHYAKVMNPKVKEDMQRMKNTIAQITG